MNTFFASLAAKFQATLATRERGATAVEYGLLVGLIAVVIILAVVALGSTLKGLFVDVDAELKKAVPAALGLVSGTPSV
jgi:pilus assembly protein Flp/PilA